MDRRIVDLLSGLPGRQDILPALRQGGAAHGAAADRPLMDILLLEGAALVTRYEQDHIPVDLLLGGAVENRERPGPVCKRFQPAASAGSCRGGIGLFFLLEGLPIIAGMGDKDGAPCLILCSAHRMPDNVHISPG